MKDLNNTPAETPASAGLKLKSLNSTTANWRI
jgi:hypothetical protein